MSELNFGPVARGIYIALLWATLLVAVLVMKGLLSPRALLAYAGLLMFLGLGLRPLLQRSGLHAWYQHTRVHIREQLDQKYNETRGRQVDQSRRNARLRNARRRDPRLPKNW